MDQAVIYFFQSFQGRFPLVDGIGIFLAVGLIWIEAALVAVFLVVDRRRWFAVMAAGVASAAAWSLNQAIGHFWFRPRPFAGLEGVFEIIGKSALDKSFPSDHAALSMSAAVAIFLVNRRWGGVFIAIAVLVSLGRVYAGVHYPSDVAAGAAIGAGCAYAVHRLGHAYLRTKHKPANL